MEERDGDGNGTPGAAFSKQQQEQQGEKRAPKNNGMVPYEEEGEEEATFASLGLCDWILTACKAMGFRRPTPVQRRCIPAVGRVVDIDTANLHCRGLVLLRWVDGLGWPLRGYESVVEAVMAHLSLGGVSYLSRLVELVPM